MTLEKEYLLSTLEETQDTCDNILSVVQENNKMLKQIIEVVNVYLARHHQENEDDFGRNVLANLISGVIDVNGFSKRK